MNTHYRIDDEVLPNGLRGSLNPQPGFFAQRGESHRSPSTVGRCTACDEMMHCQYHTSEGYEGDLIVSTPSLHDAKPK